jgi:predicted Zn-dependent protease/predicted negative regulator of RcsB-dependent stress response
MLGTRARVLYTTALLTALMVGGSVLAQRSEIPQNGRPASGASSSVQSALEEIARLFYNGEHTVVVERVDQFVKANAASLEGVTALFMKAESLYHLGRINAAADTYRDALPKIDAITNNVSRRRFAGAYFRYAELLREQRRYSAAVAATETGLRLVPQYVLGQILLGQLLLEGGQRDRALAHYRTQLSSSLPVAEERTVLGIKVDRLSPAPRKPPLDLSSALIYSGLSIGIVPVNAVPSEIALADVCAFLEGSWRLRCEVLPPMPIPEATMLDPSRDQYDGALMIKEIDRRLPPPARRQSHLLAVTGRDIFGPQTSFVFSWQQRNEQHAVGVLSTSRLASEIQDYYEPAIIATRRIALQALSTTGSMLGFMRPTDPECPLAYPESLREFQVKRLRLCSFEEQQRDQLLRRRGGAGAAFGQARAAAITQVYQRYFAE